MGSVSGGDVHSTDSVTVATWSVWVISVVAGFETVTLTTVTRVGCFVVYRHVRYCLKATLDWVETLCSLLASTHFKFKSDGH